MFNFLRSSKTVAFQFFLGRPRFIFPYTGDQFKACFEIRLSSILRTCPSHLSLLFASNTSNLQTAVTPLQLLQSLKLPFLAIGIMIRSHQSSGISPVVHMRLNNVVILRANSSPPYLSSSACMHQQLQPCHSSASLSPSSPLLMLCLLCLYPVH